MNEQEREIIALLVSAWNKFQLMEQTHPDHKRDLDPLVFANSIGKLL